MPAAESPIVRRVFSASELIAGFPPRLHDPNKRVVHGIACGDGTPHAGEITFSRWQAMSLPDVSGGEGITTLEPRDDYFGYEPLPDADSAVEWYLNFGHRDLFCAYGGALFAQDEMQVAEHPALASLREALVRSDIAPRTVVNGSPTPALIMGVERRCRVAIDPNPEAERPQGLYGNNFARASQVAVQRATVPIRPPTATNLISMEAPACGYGRYSRKEIEVILVTAFTGFRAGCLESLRERGSPVEVRIHTGFWGCGAYGGNRVLMAMLQVLAARLAGVSRLVFHSGNTSGTRTFGEAVRVLDECTIESGKQRLDDLIGRIESIGWEWGVSDGN
jgi:hypothetical protein